MKYFIGYEDFVDIFFCGLLQNWTNFRGHFYAFKRLILRSSYSLDFFVAKIPNIIWGA